MYNVKIKFRYAKVMLIKIYEKDDFKTNIEEAYILLKLRMRKLHDNSEETA